MKSSQVPHPIQSSHPLEYIFHPRSIAVVGISADLPKTWIRKLYLDSLQEGGYKGEIYLVNPKGGKMLGLPIYKSLLDLPGPVDHVVFSVPAQYTPGVMEQAAQIGVKTVHVFTSGYAETGEPDRIALQDRLVQIARRSGIRIIGPNCIGIYYPRGGIGLSPDFPMEPGGIGYVCQSGGNVTYMGRQAIARGLRFSKVVSYGNAADINECDLIDYMAHDPETKVIAAYVEGTRDGNRLVDVVRKAAAAKPLVVFKGGFTPGGQRAAASHTGSMAGSDAVWDGLLKQVGAIRVHNIDEMVDMLVALVRVEPPRGNKVAVVGNGGGASVMATDEMEQAGFELIPLPPHMREELKQFIDLANSMLRNPIDISPLAAMIGFDFMSSLGSRTCLDLLRNKASQELTEPWGKLNKLLDNWEEVDMVVYQHGFDISPTPVNEWSANGVVGPLALAARASRRPKALVLHSLANDDTWKATGDLRRVCAELEMPLFLSMQGAALALRRLVDYARAYPKKLAGLRT